MRVIQLRKTKSHDGRIHDGEREARAKEEISRINFVPFYRKFLKDQKNFMSLNWDGEPEYPVPGFSCFAGHTTEKFLQKMQCFAIKQNAGQLIKIYSTKFVDNMVGDEV